MPKGQSLNEYGLTLGLVVIVSIVGIGILGQNVRGLLGNSIERQAPQATAGVAALAAVIDAGFSPGPGTATLELSIPLPTGGTSNITIPNYPTTRGAIAQSILGPETVGANGVNEKLAMTLQQLADKLEKEGALDATQADIIRQMAQQGFALADAQKIFQQNVITGEKTGIFINPGEDNVKYSGPASKLQSLLQEAQSKGALNNPIVKALVEDAAGKIIDSGKATAQYASKMIYSSDNPMDATIKLKQLQQFTGVTRPDKFVGDHFAQTTTSATVICGTSTTSKIEGLSCVSKAG